MRKAVKQRQEQDQGQEGKGHKREIGLIKNNRNYLWLFIGNNIIFLPWGDVVVIDCDPTPQFDIFKM